MVERAVRYFLLQIFVRYFESLDFFGAVEMRRAVLLYAVDEHHMKNTAVPVRIHRERTDVRYLGTRHPAFFLEFAHGGLLRRFALVDDSCGEFQCDGPGTVTVLLRHYPVALDGACENQHPGGLPQRVEVVDDFPVRKFARFFRDLQPGRGYIGPLSWLLLIEQK